MKLLWFSHFVPFPPRGGHLQRSFHLIRQASAFAEVSLVAFNQLKEPPSVLQEHGRELGRYCSSVRFWEPPVRWKGLSWWLRLLSNPRPKMPLAARSLWSRLLGEELRRFTEREQFDVVHFDSLELSPYAQGLGGKLVLNLHNCEAAMMFRRAQQESSFARRIFLQGEASALQTLERHAYPRFATVMTVSEDDAAEVRRTAPRAHIHVVENGTDCQYFSPQGECNTAELVFAGAFNWYPNTNAALYLISEIWPLVLQEFPDAHLTIAGKQPPATLRQCVASTKQVSLVADPVDIRPVLRNAAVVVCPIREGGGTRLKILDAMAVGKPVVSTTMACAALHVSAGKNIMIADTPIEIARSIARLLNDADMRNRIGNAARRTVEEHYDWQVIRQQLFQAYNCNGECSASRAAAGVGVLEGEN